MKKLLLALILLAMVGTGFGQTTTIQPNTGTVNGHDLSAPNLSQRCYMSFTSRVAAKSAVEIPCPTSDAVPKFIENSISPAEPVDVPAIQEDVLCHHANPNMCTETEARVCGGFCGDSYKRWTCADENRALLTSVNGKRHSCHLIQEGK